MTSLFFRSFPFLLLAASARAQKPLSWDEVRDRFRQNNPQLQAGRTGVHETQANEITAGLKPNPQLSFTIDQWNFFRTDPFRPCSGSQTISSISQLIERRNKRGLRVEGAKLATAMSRTDLSDLERQIVFTLRDAFVRTCKTRAFWNWPRKTSNGTTRPLT